MNTRASSLLCILTLVIVFGIGEYAGLHYRLYWHIFWYDILMHLLGGVVVGAVYLWAATFLFPQLPKVHVRFSSVLLFVFCIGVGWEIFEAVLGIGRSVFMPYWLDTMKDIVDDLLGGAFSFLLMKQYFHG